MSKNRSVTKRDIQQRCNVVFDSGVDCAIIYLAYYDRVDLWSFRHCSRRQSSCITGTDLGTLFGGTDCANSRSYICTNRGSKFCSTHQCANFCSSYRYTNVGGAYIFANRRAECHRCFSTNTTAIAAANIATNATANRTAHRGSKRCKFVAVDPTANATSNTAGNRTANDNCAELTSGTQ